MKRVTEPTDLKDVTETPTRYPIKEKPEENPVFYRRSCQLIGERLFATKNILVNKAVKTPDKLLNL